MKSTRTTFPVEMVKCSFAVPQAGLVAGMDWVRLALMGLQYPFFTSGHAFSSYRQKGRTTALTDNAHTCLGL